VVLMRWWWAVRSRNTKGGGREGFGPKPATELPWLSCGRAVWNSGGGWCVGWHGGVYEVMVVVGGLCACEMRGGGGGLGVVAQFRARHVERRWRMVRGGGAVARTRRWQWWGRAVANHEAGRGGLGRNPKPSR
jgi:hypothetical protein